MNVNECYVIIFFNGLCATIPADNNLKHSVCSDISGFNICRQTKCKVTNIVCMNAVPGQALDERGTI
jgi:hypothetical protein